MKRKGYSAMTDPKQDPPAHVDAQIAWLEKHAQEKEAVERAWRAHLETLPFKIPPPSSAAFTAGYLAAQQAVAGERSKEPRPGPMYPPLHPWDLEPHYAAHVAAMTSEGLHSKAAIAEQLAWRDQQLEALRRIVARTLACGQLEKLEDARDYLVCHAERAGIRRSKQEGSG